MNFEINGVSSFFWIRKLRKAPEDVMQSIQDQMGSIVQGLVDYIKNDKLSGQVLHVRSGALKNSITGSYRRTLWSIKAEVNAGSLSYAEILEDGGTTSPHMIYARRAKVLRWISRSGELRFASRVYHPGSRIPAFNYMKSSLTEKEDDIKREMWEALKRGLAKDIPK